MFKTPEDRLSEIQLFELVAEELEQGEQSKGLWAKALAEGDAERTLKLFEASLSVLVRMRVGPTVTQVLLDSLQWSDTIRAMKEAGADSWSEFVTKCGQIPDIKERLPNMAQREAVALFAKSRSNTRRLKGCGEKCWSVCLK